MAIALNNSIGIASVHSPAFTVGSGSNRLLVVGIANGGAPVTAVDWNGTPLTKASLPTTNYACSIWYLIAPASGFFNINITTASSTFNGFAMDFTGAEQSTAVIDGNAESHPSPGSSDALNITTAHNNTFVVDCLFVNNSTTMTVDSSQTQLINSPIAGACSYRTVPSSFGVSPMSWTFGSSQFAEHIAVGFAGVIVKPEITFDAVSSGSNYGTTSDLTFSHTVGVGAKILLVGVSATSNLVPAATVTFNGVPMTLLTSKQADSSAAGFSYIFYLLNPPAGTHNIVVHTTTDGFGGDRIAGGLSLFGTDNSAPSNTATHADSSSSGQATIVTTVTGSLLFEVCCEYSNVDTVSPGSGQTNVITASKGCVAYRANTTPQSYTELFGFSSTFGRGYSVCLAEIIPGADNTSSFFSILSRRGN